MASIIVLASLIVVTIAVLCYLFNDARIEIEAPTIAAMEARADSFATQEPATEKVEMESPATRRYPTTGVAKTVAEPDPGQAEIPLRSETASYEYREMLEEGGENYVLPQWMINYFSSSDICHTLDPGDNVIFIAKLNDPANAEKLIDISAECDMGTQTVALKACFGEGATGETLKMKFYLFERGDLFELNRLTRQKDLRIDALVRSAELTLEYLGTIHMKLPQNVSTQLKGILAKIPA
ncbi:hypothetical protein HZA56_20740 [Candidatus Poribacteria bacterium]|nr:hypothetical protein [Candidatus Poribacteria bacterium]